MPVPIAVEHQALVLGGQLPPRHVHRHAVAATHLGELRAFPGGALARPRTNRTTLQGLVAVRNHLAQVHADGAPETSAFRARPQRRLIGKEPRSRRIQRPRALRTGEPLTQHEGGPVRMYVGDTVTALPRALDGRTNARLLARAHRHPVEHHLRSVSDGLAGLHAVDLPRLSPEPQPPVAVLGQRLAHLQVLLGVLDAQRIAQHRALTTGAIEGAPHGALHVHAHGFRPVHWAHRRGFPREQRREIRLQISHRRDSGPRALHRRPTIHGDARGHRIEPLHRRPLQPFQELPRVRTEALHEAPLPLGIQRVHREAALARAAHAGDHHQLARPQREIHTGEIVSPGTFETRGQHEEGGS